MRVAITGATGFVGSFLGRALHARGDEVVALVRRPAADLEAAGTETRLVDLTQATGAHVADVDVIIHVAASSDPDLEVARLVNRDATRALAQAALAAGVSRFVHVSTTSVYDRDATEADVLAEDAPMMSAAGGRPTVTSSGTAYAVSKAEGELAVQAAIADGLNAAILRPPAVLGPGPTSTWGTRVPARIRDGEPVPGPRASTFGFVAVEDLVRAVLAAADQPVIDVVNVIGGHVRLGDYLDAVAAFVGRQPHPGDGPAWHGRYDTTRLGTQLAITPTVDFTAAMATIAGAWPRHGSSADGPPAAPPGS